MTRTGWAALERWALESVSLWPARGARVYIGALHAQSQLRCLQGGYYRTWKTWFWEGWSCFIPTELSTEGMYCKLSCSSRGITEVPNSTREDPSAFSPCPPTLLMLMRITHGQTNRSPWRIRGLLLIELNCLKTETDANLLVVLTMDIDCSTAVVCCCNSSWWDFWVANIELNHQCKNLLVVLVLIGRFLWHVMCCRSCLGLKSGL